MKEILKQLTSQMEVQAQAPEESLVNVQGQLGVQLPLSYLDFMREYNGAEGIIGVSYLVIWPIEDLPLYNQRDALGKFELGIIQFGSDGGGEAYAFDMNMKDMPIIEVPFISIDLSDARICGENFTQFLEFLYSRRY